MSIIKAKVPVLLTPLDKATRIIKINFTEWGQENKLYMFLHEVGRKDCVRFISFLKLYTLTFRRLMLTIVDVPHR